MINNNSFVRNATRPKRERGNAYVAPNAHEPRARRSGVLRRGLRLPALGWRAAQRRRPAQQPQPRDQERQQEPALLRAAAVAVQPASSSTGSSAGKAPKVDAPEGLEGTEPADARRSLGAAPAREGLLDGQGDPQLRADPRDGRLHAVVLRDPALPVAGVRRLDPAEAGVLPLRGGVPRGRHAVGRGRRPHRRRERRQGQEEAPRQGGRHARSPSWRSRRRMRRFLGIRGRSCGRRRCWGRRMWSLSTGDRSGPMLPDGGRLADVFVEPTVELDEIFNAFDKPTRTAFQDWVRELSKAVDGGRGQDLNDAFGNLEGFSVDGAKLLSKLDEQEVAVRRLIKNTGVVFGAIESARGCVAGCDCEFERGVRGDGVARRCVGGDVPGVPDVLGRVAGDVGSVGAFFERHASVGELR